MTIFFPKYGSFSPEKKSHPAALRPPPESALLFEGRPRRSDLAQCGWTVPPVWRSIWPPPLAASCQMKCEQLAAPTATILRSKARLRLHGAASRVSSCAGPGRLLKRRRFDDVIVNNLMAAPIIFVGLCGYVLLFFFLKKNVWNVSKWLQVLKSLSHYLEWRRCFVFFCYFSKYLVRCAEWSLSHELLHVSTDQLLQ